MKPYLYLLALLLAQGPGAPPRSTLPASVEGIVTRAGTGEPVVRAHVILGRMDPGGAGPGATATTTDESGRFIVAGLTPGTFRVTVTHDGYAAAEYGQRSQGLPGVPVTLAPDQKLRDVAIAMVPLGTITGRVFDSYGDPLGNAYVQSFRYAYPEGKRTLTRVQTVRSNDLGEYRMYWMAPGSYVLSASPPDGARPGTSDGGAAYVPVYFPGTTDPAGAAAVDLRAGTSFSGADFTVATTTAVRIRGSVMDSMTAGQPLRGALIVLMPRESLAATAAGPQTAQPAAAGGFEFRGVVPGSYILAVTSGGGVATSGQASHVMGAVVPVEVGNTDMDNVVLTLRPGFNVRGQIVVEGQQSAAPSTAPRMSVMLRPDPQVASIGPLSNLADPAGAFTIANAIPWSYRVVLNNLPRNFYLKSASLDGMDMLSGAQYLESEPRKPVEIVLGANPASLDAAVLDDKGKPASGFTVVLVPSPDQRKRYDLFKWGTTDASGHVHMDGLVPGDYKAFAWESVEFSAWADPAFLALYEDRGQAIHLDEAGKPSITLRPIPAR